MASLIKTNAENIIQLFREASAFIPMESVFTNHVRITDDGTLADFVDVKLESDGEKEAWPYLHAEPDDELNVDPKEIRVTSISLGPRTWRHTRCQ